VLLAAGLGLYRLMRRSVLQADGEAAAQPVPLTDAEARRLRELLDEAAPHSAAGPKTHG
jgi:hypothetical protein